MKKSLPLSLIAALAENRVIGVDNSMPWHLPADFKYFKATTLGKPIIMGRKTWDSLGRPLPGRLNLVVSEVMLIGGAQLYAQGLADADRLYLTRVGMSPEGDAWFPEFDQAQWKRVSEELHEAADDKPAFSFEVWERI